MWKGFVCVSLLSGLFVSAAAQDSANKPQAEGDAPKTESPRRRDGADLEALQRLTELEKKLTDKPDDKQSLSLYVKSLGSYVNAATRSAQRMAGRHPSEAVKRFQLAKSAIERIPQGIEDAEAGREFERVRRVVAQAEERLARILKHDQLIGAKAAPLNVEHWVSGTPLTDVDLQGKVVVLDFFAVWCRPNIETFPELANWRAKYGDKRLVIVGLTKYYNYQWDERTQSPRKTSGEVPQQTEREMLQKFAELHELKHSLGMPADAELFDFYGVTAVPQVVIIDQDGIIRLIRAGGQSENVPEIAAMLDKLLGDPVTGDETNPR
jgi:thiol-disulfide isomerase/thioredoxin